MEITASDIFAMVQLNIITPEEAREAFGFKKTTTEEGK